MHDIQLQITNLEKHKDLRQVFPLYGSTCFMGVHHFKCYDIGVYVVVVRTICYRLVVICFVHKVVAIMMPRRRFHKLTHMGGQAVVPMEMTHISMS